MEPGNQMFICNNKELVPVEFTWHVVTAERGDVVHADPYLCISMSLVAILQVMIQIASKVSQRTQVLSFPTHTAPSKLCSRGSPLSHYISRCNLDETPQRPCFSLSRDLERVKFFCLYYNEFTIFSNSNY